VTDVEQIRLAVAYHQAQIATHRESLVRLREVCPHPSEYCFTFVTDQGEPDGWRCMLCDHMKP
jgi:hypothetical protein